MTSTDTGLQRKTSWIIIALFLLAVGAMFGAFSSGNEASTAPETLPRSSAAFQARELGEQFPGGDTLPAIVVFHSDVALNVAQLQALPSELAESVQGAAVASPVIPINDTTAQATLSLPGELSGFAVSDAVAALREAGESAAPNGVEVLVTGPAGFAADTANAFKGANFTMLAVTALVVAALLIITYRSPVLWLIPLLVTALADRVAAIVTAELSAATGWFAADGSTSGITSVLVFGAGTNYALLLVSRYREELLVERDHTVALRRAWKASIPAIVSSNLTVVLALQTLLLASIPAFRSLGLSSSIGLLIALLFALVLLPAALNVCGRGLFWPRIPRVGAVQTNGGAFETVARHVDARPWRYLVGFGAALLILGCGVLGTGFGLTTTEQFRTQSQAVDAAKLLDSASPLQAYAPADEELDLQGIAGVTVLGAPQMSTDGAWQRVNFVVADDNTDVVAQVRAQTGAIVGGQLAESIDNRAGTIRDMKLIVPLIFLAVFIVLVVVLRALVAPIFLLSAAALSTWAAIGAGTLVSTHVFGFPALDVAAPLYSILFLVALGIDYTVFLVLRAQEEARGQGTREGMVRAVGLTGGVITSAGIVLAAVFAVLGVLPLITLTQVGILVGFGIILDTFLVRTLIVPAMFSIVGDAMWLPRKVQHGG